MEQHNTQEEDWIYAKINALQMASEWIPGIKIVQNNRPYQNLYLCEQGQNYFGITDLFFKHLPPDEFQKRIFDPEAPFTCLLGVQGETNAATKRFYIRYDKLEAEHKVDLIIVHPFITDPQMSGRYTFTQIIPVSFQPWAVPKTKRVVQEMSFRKENVHKFSQLTERNKEVLALIARCFKAEEIGERLFIGVNTVNSHKKRIKEVLETTSNRDLMQYAKAFDLW
jgi:DNA-binding CsgD family transcriptional regulator